MIVSLPEAAYNMLSGTPVDPDKATLWARAEVELPSGAVQVWIRTATGTPVPVVGAGIILAVALVGNWWWDNGPQQPIAQVVRSRFDDLFNALGRRHVSPWMDPFLGAANVLCGDRYAAVETCTDCQVIQDQALEAGLLEWIQPANVPVGTSPYLRWRQEVCLGGRIEQREEGGWDWERPLTRDENVLSSFRPVFRPRGIRQAPPAKKVKKTQKRKCRAKAKR